MTPEHLAEIRAIADGPDWPQWGDGDVRELLDHIAALAAENQRLREHQQRLLSWITPRLRYTLHPEGDELVLRCADHEGRVAYWVGEPYPFHQIDQAAHEHEVWHHNLKGPAVTDTTPEPERPFDPEAAARVEAFADLWLIPGRNAIERIHADRVYELLASDLLEVLRQLAWHKQTGEQLAEKCARVRGQYEEARAKLDELNDEYAIRVRDPEDHATWRTDWGFSTPEEALDSLGGSCQQPRTVLHRLVSNWQPADTKDKP